jgi:hypothetical protein
VRRGARVSKPQTLDPGLRLSGNGCLRSLGGMLRTSPAAIFSSSRRDASPKGASGSLNRAASLVRSIPPSGARQTLSVGPDTCPVSAHNLAARAPESQSHSRLSCGGYFLGHHPCDFRLSCRAARSDLQKPQCNDLLCFHAQPRCLRHQIQPTPEQSTSPSVLYERHRGRLGPTFPDVSADEVGDLQQFSAPNSSLRSERTGRWI